MKVWTESKKEMKEILEEIFLKEKIQYEFDNFLLTRKMCGKEKRIDRGREIQEKKQILIMLKQITMNLSVEEIKLLNAQKNLLEYIYDYLQEKQVSATRDHICQGISVLLAGTPEERCRRFYGIVDEPDIIEELDYEEEGEVPCLPLLRL